MMTDHLVDVKNETEPAAMDLAALGVFNAHAISIVEWKIFEDR